MKLKSSLFYQTKILIMASFQAFQESLDAIPFSRIDPIHFQAFSISLDAFLGFPDKPGCISRFS